MKRLLAGLGAEALLLAACSGSADDATDAGADTSDAQATDASPLQDCTKLGQGFTGGATVPRQIYGSYGPGQSLGWDVATGTTTGDAQNVEMATGFPNGIVTILWGEGAKAGSNVMTVECTTAWDVYDPNDLGTLWQAGIIFDEIPGLGTNTYFCHHIVMDDSTDSVTMKMWETYWTYGEDYTCPDTLRGVLDGEITDFPNAITYLELPSTGIGAPPVPPEDWTADGTSVGVNLG